MSRKKPRRVRWPKSPDTLKIALELAAKPAHVDILQIEQAMISAFSAMRKGGGTDLNWSVVAGALEVAQKIEEQGVVKGLATHFAIAEEALKAIHQRDCKANGWHPSELEFWEMDAIQTFIELHQFQLRYLSRGELLSAMHSAAEKIFSSGGKAIFATSKDIERMVA